MTSTAILRGGPEPTFSISASTTAVQVRGEGSYLIYDIYVTGVRVGEARVTITASSPGYDPATATFHVTVTN